MTDGSVTNPAARRTVNRRKTKSKIYASKSWKEKKAAFVNGKKCEWCGSTENLLPHHPYQDTPNGVYEDLYLSGCIVVCGTCHFMYERRHKQHCPVCKTGWMPLKGVETCRACDLKLHPEKAHANEKAAFLFEHAVREKNKAAATRRRVIKRDFPCTFRGIEQRCRCKPGTVCGYSKTKAKNCPDFRAKKGVVKK